MDRLPAAPTERIDRDRAVPFSFAGRPLGGYEGDTVASALWGAGVRVFGRSFEYHRPRGLYDLEGEGASQLVSIDGIPNRSAGTTLLRSGMTIAAQNVRGDPRSDRYAALDRCDRWMPAGFYYRLFHRPYAAWPFFQGRMRALAGLGVLDVTASHDAGRRAELYLNADVAVIGGGPAGLTAALAAAEHVDRVCLFERRPWLGGHHAWRVRERGGVPLHERAATLAARVESNDRIRVFRHAPVTGVWGENLVTGFQVGGPSEPFDERHWECRARAVVVATGSIERPLIFNDNDRPGVLQADTAWRLAATYGVRPGRRAVFSVADDLALEAALDLASRGVEVVAVADARRGGHDSALLAGLDAAGVEVLPGHAASAVLGRKGVSAVDIGPIEEGSTRRLACDLVVASAGRQPDIGVLSTAGARFAFSAHQQAFEPTGLPAGVYAAGATLGLTDPDSIEASGRVAGLEAATGCGVDVGAELDEARATQSALPGPPAGCGLVHGPHLGEGRKAFIDFDEDGTWKNAKQCIDQGFDVPELAKRFGNFGLGPGQYRVPGQNLAMAMAELGGRDPADIVSTTVRPPVVPPSLATVAGPGHRIVKRTPLHEEQAALGAIFRRAGAWERARYFSDDFSCRAEIRNVRTGVGVLDSSPLGKFRLFGPDAMRALQRVYISDMRKVRPGRCRYSAMCNDTGNIIDDGVVVEVGDDDFYLTTSSNRAGVTVEWFRFHTRHDGWDYHLVNLTDALASLNVAGPRAREVLERVTDADLSNEALPYMGYREIGVGDGVRARCLRLGFVGELSYELHVGAGYARYVWDLLREAGADAGIQPFGLEAQNAMRAEKGHVIVGVESEQRVTLLDIGLGWLWDRDDTASRKVGAPALRACESQTGRLKLVGLRVEVGSGDDGPADAGPADAGPVDSGPADSGPPGGTPRDGALIVHGAEIAGHVCTTRYSETLGWRFGLALVRDDLRGEGTRLELRETVGGRSRRFSATVVPPHFYDPRGERLRA